MDFCDIRSTRNCKVDCEFSFWHSLEKVGNVNASKVGRTGFTPLHQSFCTNRRSDADIPIITSSHVHIFFDRLVIHIFHDHHLTAKSQHGPTVNTLQAQFLSRGGSPWNAFVTSLLHLPLYGLAGKESHDSRVLSCVVQYRPDSRQLCGMTDSSLDKSNKFSLAWIEQDSASKTERQKQAIAYAKN